MKKLRLREVRSLSKVYKTITGKFIGYLTAWCVSQFPLLLSNQPVFYRIHSILILNDLLSWIVFPRRKIYDKKHLTLIPSIVISSYTFYDKFLPSYYSLLTSPSSPIPVKLIRSKEFPKMSNLQREILAFSAAGLQTVGQNTLKEGRDWPYSSVQGVQLDQTCPCLNFMEPWRTYNL